jgi:Outer membrane lipoprotein
LAGAEMNIGRWYEKQKVYTAAIGRFRTVIEKYQTTSHVPEALLRLVECYIALGIPNEAKATAAVLGYNFPGSDWYQDAYDLLASNHLTPEQNNDSWVSKYSKPADAQTSEPEGSLKALPPPEPAKTDTAPADNTHAPAAKDDPKPPKVNDETLQNIWR